MKKLLKISLLLFSFNAFAKPGWGHMVILDVKCDKNPIYCQIVKNSSSINKKYAMRLSNIIHKMHKKYHIPSRIFTAILRQESNYTLKVNGCHRGLVLPQCEKLRGPESIRVKCKLYPNEFIEEVRVCSDFGISQIYFKTAQKFDINIERLTTDLDYSVEAGAIVLADFMKRYEAKDNDWYLRYNCGTRGTTERDTCQIYKRLVERYL